MIKGAAVVALFFLALILVRWSKTPGTLLACTFQHPDCSTAVSTWALCLITSLAFLAAYDAAIKAGAALTVSSSLLEIELQQILGVWICTKNDPHIARVSLYIEDFEVTANRPRAHERESFEKVPFDFQNLGRSALVQVRVFLRLRERNVDRLERLVDIGNIARDDMAHVDIYFLRNSVDRPLIGWSSHAIVSGRLVEYVPPPFVTVETETTADGTSRTVAMFVEEIVGNKLTEPTAPDLGTTDKTQRRSDVAEEPEVS